MNWIPEKELIERYKDKQSCQKRYKEHTIAQLKKRFWINSTVRDYNNLCKKASRQDGICLWGLSKRKKIWLLNYKNKIVVVVYNNGCRSIETVYPQGFNLESYIKAKGLV